MWRSSTLASVAAALWLYPLAAMAGRPVDCGFYAYGNGGSFGRHCAGTAQNPPPQRVTALCRDGSFSYDQGNGTCWEHGGVAIWRR
jgi:hypothetical protein